jgi:hypothetical protein|tara:strand:+ start:40 stop:600 length:561 start_codon:yes stop_codon:yes gene_type:complete
MALNALKIVPDFSDQDISEFVEYKQNLKEFTTKVAKFQKVLDKFSKDTGQDKNLPSLKGETEGAVTHDFADGQYIRTIVMPKGLALVSRIHNKNHPFFIMKGECSIYTEKGLERIKAPHNGVTLAGTQRLMFIHEECTFITVHRTDCLTPEEVVNEVTVENLSESSLEGFDIKQIDNLINKFEVNS